MRKIKLLNSREAVPRIGPSPYGEDKSYKTEQDREVNPPMVRMAIFSRRASTTPTNMYMDSSAITTKKSP
jgi:hypothetical protein